MLQYHIFACDTCSVARWSMYAAKKKTTTDRKVSPHPSALVGNKTLAMDESIALFGLLPAKHAQYICNKHDIYIPHYPE
jgi:hypothetical protein